VAPRNSGVSNDNLRRSMLPDVVSVVMCRTQNKDVPSDDCTCGQLKDRTQCAWPGAFLFARHSFYTKTTDVAGWLSANGMVRYINVSLCDEDAWLDARRRFCTTGAFSYTLLAKLIQFYFQSCFCAEQRVESLERWNAASVRAAALFDPSPWQPEAATCSSNQ